MSTLQSRAKPFLVPFLQGQWPVLSEWGLRSVVVWITMFSMVFEFRDPATAAIPFNQRDQFRRTRDPLNHWRMWIGKIDANVWRGKTFHTGVGLYEPSMMPINPAANLQITTAAVGKLLIHSFYVPRDVAEIELTPAYDIGLGITRIWPPENATPLRPIRILADRDADNVSQFLRNSILGIFK
jgi:hypothetical protein